MVQQMLQKTQKGNTSGGKSGRAIFDNVAESLSRKPKHLHVNNDTITSAAYLKRKRDCKRMIIWGTTIVIVALQLMVANIIYLYPSQKFNHNIERYTMVDFVPTNNIKSFDISTSSVSSSSSNLQRRIAVVPDVSKIRIAVPTTSKKQVKTTSNSINHQRPLRPTGILKITKMEGSVKTNSYNFRNQVNHHKNSSAITAKVSEVDNDSAIDASTLDSILSPIRQEGIMYSVCRGDRSGSVIADMIYAHAFAFKYNVTYGGNCCVTRGLPKEDTKNLIKDLHWQMILPFRCPKGVNNKKYNVLRPNATSIHPLLLNPEVYRLKGRQSNFKLPWKQSIKDALYKFNDHRKNHPYIIAVHVRRGDVTPCTYKRRYLPNSHYLSLIEQYTPNSTTLDGRPLQVHIYSESDSFESFDEFVQRNYTMMIDTTNLAHVWKALSTADVAILSRSYFSIVPAILNPNIVVATDFFEFDVRMIPNWEYADSSIVRSSEEQIRQMFINDCNNTKQFTITGSGSNSNVKKNNTTYSASNTE